MDGNSPDPIVSVLVTVFNRETYLAECLESIRKSLFSDFEVIVVDDQSTDRSVEIAKKFAEKDGRISVHVNPSNLGDYPNRNQAARLAKGQYLKYVDSDDMIEPDCFGKMVDALGVFPAAAYALSYPRPRNLPRPGMLTPREAYEAHLLDRQGIFSSGPLLSMIRADRFWEVGGFRPTARNMGDVILWMELSQRWPMVIVEDGLTYWRQHEGQEYSLVRDDSADNAATHCKLNAVLLRDFLRRDTCPLENSARKQVRRQAHRRNLQRILWHIRHGRIRLAAFELKWAAQMMAGIYSGLPESDAAVFSAVSSNGLNK